MAEINTGDVLREYDSEPPVGTVVELHDGERWERLPVAERWCWTAHHDPARSPSWTWGRVTFDGPVTVVQAPEAGAAP